MALVIPERRLGSSPRVRGKRDDDLAHPCGARLIPACAGKTPPRGASFRPSGAHPRVCGENHGKAENSYDPGLIPACAGKTTPSRATISLIAGSSPRVRGKRRRRWRSP